MPIFLALLLNVAAAGQPASIAGEVVDQSGAAVADASVRLEVAGATVTEMRTGQDGRFELAAERRPGARLIVVAAGFAQSVTPVEGGAGALTITLQPAPFFEAVNVTSTRTDIPRADPTVTVTVIPATEMLTSGAVTIDDALKMVPTFTLFRRTSSRTSNPTAQGVALRGLGGTGASRSLVLANGVPLNDAFGGWVYWDKVPQAAIDRVEVQRGSGSDLYGADAVGGVVQILTTRPGRPTARALVEGGNMGTGRVSLFGGDRRGPWTYSAGGQWYTTDGYISVAAVQDPGVAPRGPIDTEFASAHRSGLVSVGYQAANGWRVDGSGNVFSEDRLNGSPAVTNATSSRLAAGEAAGGIGGGLLSVRAYGGTQDYDQTFSAINATRTAETLNRVQRVPTTVNGVGGQWLRPVGRHAVLVGVETRYVEGTTIETPFSAQGAALATTQAGGTQRLTSGFAQATLNVNDRLTLVAGAHGDNWHTASSFTPYDNTVGSLSPRASAAYRLGESGVTLRGSAYRGFRAPTLNEFYRGFRVGNVQTTPNEALLPEKLSGADAGALIARGPVSARVTGFWNVLDDAITNVTISTTPALITRQRANADKVHASGVEIEGAVRLPRDFSATAGIGIMSSHYRGDTPLKDKQVPQVPRYNLGAGVRYTPGPWTGSAQLRMTGAQFDDDQNVFRLRPATVLDVYAGRDLYRGLQVFVAVENLFDEEYDVGRTPILTTGLPRAVRVGAQISIP